MRFLFKHTSEDVEEKVKPTSATPFQGHRRVASWLLFLTILVVILILWGGIVRLSGSGLSIPDWPLINWSLLPPLSDSDWQKVYQSYKSQVSNLTDPQSSVEISLSRFKFMFAIEYIHRFLASIVGIIFLAFLFFGLLLWMALKISVTEANLSVQKKSKGTALAWITMGVVFMQIISGGLMAGTKAGLVLNTFPKMGDYLVPPVSALWSTIYETPFHNLIQNQITNQFIHRWWA